MTISRREMIAKLHMSLVNAGRASDLTKTDLAKILDMYEGLIEAALLNGQSYRLGSIGTLVTATRKPGRVKIPRTDRYVDIPAKTGCKVRVTPQFSALLNIENQQ